MPNLTRVIPLALLAGLLVLSACKSPPEPACPRASVVADAANVTKFRDGPGRDLTDVLVEGEFVDLLVQCKYGKNVVNIDLQVAVAGVRGPANRSRAAEFEYFVAIADPARNIVAKELFKARFQFADNDPRVVQLEELEPRIPLADVFKAPDYEIFIGFQLTEAELAWNRARRKN